MSEPKPQETLLTRIEPLAEETPAVPPTNVPAAPATVGETTPGSPGARGPLPVIPGHEVLDELGRGGMGIVYRARQEGLNRLVAVKMLLPGALASGEEEGRFRAEAAAIARLRHPHIVQVYQIGQVGGQHFFTLEYCPGGSLAARLKGKPLAPAVAAAVVEKLADAVQTAHDAGIVHRDLKPANVLLMDTEPVGGQSMPSSRGGGLAPKITDFGLAKHLDRDHGQTRSGVIMGTPSYMAPEQAMGQARSIGPAADVYALGAVLYELLTGRPPFRGESLMETLEQVRSHEPISPRRIDPEVPRELEAVVLKCLEKQPRHRYGSARDLAEDLGRWRDGKVVHARKGFFRRRVAKLVRRKGTLVAMAGLALAGLVLFVILADRGVAVPGGEAIRNRIDRHELSPQRPAPSIAHLNSAASQLRGRIVERLEATSLPEGRFPDRLDGSSKREADSWSMSQIVASLSAMPEKNPALCRAALAALDRSFADFVPGYGFRLEFPRGNPSSLPTLWGLIAVAYAHRTPDLIPAEQKPLWSRRLGELQEALEKYLSHPPDSATPSGGWNTYPNQVDPADASIYSSGLALLALLEMKRHDLPWRGSTERRDELLDITLAWVLARHDGQGWRCLVVQGNEFNDGLTIFLYAVLERAEDEAGRPMPEAVAAAMRDYLAGLGDRPESFPVSVGFFGSSFTDPTGRVVIDATRQVRFLWFAWSLDAVSRWLDRTRKCGAAHEETVRARRVLGHLLDELGPAQVDQVLSGFTFVAAETLLGLAGVELRE